MYIHFVYQPENAQFFYRLQDCKTTLRILLFLFCILCTHRARKKIFFLGGGLNLWGQVVNPPNDPLGGEESHFLLDRGGWGV